MTEPATGRRLCRQCRNRRALIIRPSMSAVPPWGHDREDTAIIVIERVEARFGKQWRQKKVGEPRLRSQLLAPPSRYPFTAPRLSSALTLLESISTLRRHCNAELGNCKVKLLPQAILGRIRIVDVEKACRTAEQEDNQQVKPHVCCGHEVIRPNLNQY